MDTDLALALRLQKEYHEENGLPGQANICTTTNNGVTNNIIGSNLLSVIDKQWETLDPNPDIGQLFLEFNDAYFWGKLSGIEVKWSPRMTLCAGLCVYEGRGGLCSVRLSEPLLKLRARKDLIETLLHEMIHAYLFVTENLKDHDGHGPEFQKHMHRLNKLTGANITIYHSFHDEVDNYRQHWWRCYGPCQKRPPYFGMVKRSMNRAPAPHDSWWEDHQRTCGGTYHKIKEPENYKKHRNSKQNSNKETPNSGDIRNFIKKKETTLELHEASDNKVDRIKFPGKGFSLTAPSVEPSTSRILTADASEDNRLDCVIDCDEVQTQNEGVENTVEHVQNSKKRVFILDDSDSDDLFDIPVDVNTADKRELPAKKLKLEEIHSGIDNSQNEIPGDSVSLDYVSCPVCLTNVKSTMINDHLDQCL